MTLTSVTGYAKLHGVSKAAAQKWQARGLLKFKDGQVDIEASDQSLAHAGVGRFASTATKSRRRPATKAATSAPKVAAPVAGLNPALVGDLEEAAAQGDEAARTVLDFMTGLSEGRVVNLIEAQTIKENALAAIRMIEARKRAGEVVEMADAEAAFFDVFRQHRDAWLNFSSRIGPLLAADLGLEPDRVVEALTVHVHQHLTDSTACGMTEFFLEKGFHGIECQRTNVMDFSFGQVRDFNGHGIIANGASHYIFRVVMDVDNDTYTPMSGVYSEQNGGNIMMMFCDILHPKRGLWLNPGEDQYINWVLVTNVTFDSLTFVTNQSFDSAGVAVTPTGDGSVYGLMLCNFWTATGHTGLKIKGQPTRTQIHDVIIANWQSQHNYGPGLEAEHCDRISILNPIVVGNSLADDGEYSGIVLGDPRRHAPDPGLLFCEGRERGPAGHGEPRNRCSGGIHPVRARQARLTSGLRPSPTIWRLPHGLASRRHRERV